jgi:hypothetical protein
MLVAHNPGDPASAAAVRGRGGGGGGYRRHRDRQLMPARPAVQLDQQEIHLNTTLDKIANLFR